MDQPPLSSPEATSPAVATCPRCASTDVERDVIHQTSMRVVSGVVFFCNTCALTSQALASDREAWFDSHKLWRCAAVPEDTMDAFLARWTKKVGQENFGHPEPLGPILPVVDAG